jgi:hypothetical protein
VLAPRQRERWGRNGFHADATFFLAGFIPFAVPKVVVYINNRLHVHVDIPNRRSMRKTCAGVTSVYRIVGLKFDSCIGGDAFIPNRFR